jgi:hypothetical protein
LLWRGILPIIPPKTNRREPPACDFRRYRDRNHVERLFNRLKQTHRIATRYDKTAASSRFPLARCAKLLAQRLCQQGLDIAQSIRDEVKFGIEYWFAIIQLPGHARRRS